MIDQPRVPFLKFLFPSTYSLKQIDGWCLLSTIFTMENCWFCSGYHKSMCLGRRSLEDCFSISVAVRQNRDRCPSILLSFHRPMIRLTFYWPLVHMKCDEGCRLENGKNMRHSQIIALVDTKWQFKSKRLVKIFGCGINCVTEVNRSYLCIAIKVNWYNIVENRFLVVAYPAYSPINQSVGRSFNLLDHSPSQHCWLLIVYSYRHIRGLMHSIHVY